MTMRHVCVRLLSKDKQSSWGERDRAANIRATTVGGQPQQEAYDGSPKSPTTIAYI
jgi:hypothetical protein